MSFFRLSSFFFLLVFSVLLFNCTGRYFHDAGTVPPHITRHPLSELPFKEYWTGIILNGSTKIGFSRLSINPSKDDTAYFDIYSDAAFRIRFLMLDKKINLRSFDQVDSNLLLKRFVYHYNLDGSVLELTGEVLKGRIEIDIKTRGQTTRQSFVLGSELYPSSAIGLYPVLHGLSIGRDYSYQVYDGQTQSLATVEQKVMAYETSDLFEGPAFKVRTRLHGQEVLSWIDLKGRPILEISQGGFIISTLETEKTAQKYLTMAAISKDETLLGFSLIHAEIPGFNRGQLQKLEVAIWLPDTGFSLPTDDRQECLRRDNEYYCRIHSNVFKKKTSLQEFDNQDRFLKSSFVISSYNPQVQSKAAEIVSGSTDKQEQVGLLLQWMQRNIKQEAVDVFTSLDVLEGGKAECQGHAYLFTAFARSLGIPSRVVNGIVYSPEYQGFLYHTWVEIYLTDHWNAVDPTFNQFPADATHIKFIEGETVSDLLPLVSLIGNVKLRIISSEQR